MYYWLTLTEAPFDSKTFMNALKRETLALSHKSNDELATMETYTAFHSCTGVLQWANLLFTPTPGVAVNLTNVEHLAFKNYGVGAPDRLTFTMTVNIPDDKYNPGDHKGALVIVSPIEIPMAAILACYRDIKKSCPDAQLQKWKEAFRNVQFDFVKVPENSTSLYAFHMREKMLDEGESVGWTALQRVQLVIRERHSLKLAGRDVSAPKLAAHFSRVTLARSSEKLKAGFIDCAATVEDRVLSIDSCAAILSSLDSLYGVRGPFNSVYKLQSVINKSKTPAMIAWVLTSLVDALKMTWLDVGDFTVKKLETTLCPLAIMKYQCHKYFLTVFLDTHPFKAVCKKRIREVFADHAAVRNCLAPYPNAPPGELAWLGNLPDSTRKLSDLIEGLVFGEAHDSSLKQGIKYNKCVDDVLQYNLVKEDIDMILECLQKEQQVDPQTPILFGSSLSAAAGPTLAEGGAGSSQDAAMAGAEPVHKKAKEQVDGMRAEDQAYWINFADKLVRQYVRIVVYPADQKQMVQVGGLALRRGRGGGRRMGGGKGEVVQGSYHTRSQIFGKLFKIPSHTQMGFRGLANYVQKLSVRCFANWHVRLFGASLCYY